MRQLLWFALLCICIGCGLDMPSDVADAYDRLPDHIDYNFHIKPILSDRCYACHGPDEQTRKGGFRLDFEESAKSKTESGQIPIVEGSPLKSSLCIHILSDDENTMMPPPESRLALTAYEKALLIKWIDYGAEYKKHWSFIPPKLPEVPESKERNWLVHNEIDRFIQARLKQEGLKPNPMASQERLLKRVYMDLTGLPPSVPEMDAFLEDKNPNVYEKVVDYLLTSEACAERLALEWMDVARYADSHGMHADGWRNMWPWRDWVIAAFQKNMPYNKFVTEQLAGDLLPNATHNQILATAFHRNHPMTAEGGAIDEEFRLEYVADRTNTTATALMGLTMECARCHDHKFDPINQREYYEMTAFFNNVREVGMTGDDGNYGPLLQLASEETQEKLREIRNQILNINHKLSEESSQIESLRKYVSEVPVIDLRQGLLLSAGFDKKSEANIQGRNRRFFDQNKRIYSNGDPKLVEGVTGGKAVQFLDEYDEVYLDRLEELDVEKSISVSLWINTEKRKEGKTQVLVGNAGDKNNFWRGWDFYLEEDNTLSARLINALPHNLIHIRSEKEVPLNQWTHVAFTYDGSGQAMGMRLFINGAQVVADVLYDRLYQNIRPIGSGAQEEIDRPLRISKSYRSFTGDNGIFRGSIDHLFIYDRAISRAEIAVIFGHTVGELDNTLKLDHAIRQDKKIIALEKQRSDLVRKLISINDTIPEIMVMEEMLNPRPTFVLDRGQYDAPKEVVNPATPKSILPFPQDLPRNRLGLARWLFHPDHPLTARATVNRYWQMIFGRGIVESARDFGNQGKLPSHPALLDWLAINFQKGGWDVKALLKLMVMSATYQQSSVATDIHQEQDPENILLARGSSYRWPAELIRDNALAASGLLVRKIGGPSVRPYQPEGLWIEKGTFSHKLLRYREDQGEGLYRRSLYTFLKRTSPHPAMTVFDAPNRDVCTVSRESTNTPLQALVLLNDPQFVEAARVLSARMVKEGGMHLRDQIVYGFRLVSGRTPLNEEIEVLEKIFSEGVHTFTQERPKALTLLKVGQFKHDPLLPVVESGAMTLVASTLLNMDESYMKR